MGLSEIRYPKIACLIIIPPVNIAMWEEYFILKQKFMLLVLDPMIFLLQSLLIVPLHSCWLQ